MHFKENNYVEFPHQRLEWLSRDFVGRHRSEHFVSWPVSTVSQKGTEKRKQNVPFDVLPWVHSPPYTAQASRPVLHNALERPDAIFKMSFCFLIAFFSFFERTNYLHLWRHLIWSFYKNANLWLIYIKRHFPKDASPKPNTIMKPMLIRFLRKPIWTENVKWIYLLSGTMSSNGSLSGSTQCCSVVVEIAGRIHLVLRTETKNPFIHQPLRKCSQTCTECFISTKPIQNGYF